MQIILNFPPIDFHGNVKNPLTVYGVHIYAWSKNQKGRTDCIARDDSVDLFFEIDASFVSMVDSRPSRFWNCMKVEFVNGD